MSEQPAPLDSEHSWDQGFDGHEQAQQDRLARLPFAAKLEWLEEAHRLVRNLQESRRRAGLPVSDEK